MRQYINNALATVCTVFLMRQQYYGDAGAKFLNCLLPGFGDIGDMGLSGSPFSFVNLTIVSGPIILLHIMLMVVNRGNLSSILARWMTAWISLEVCTPSSFCPPC